MSETVEKKIEAAVTQSETVGETTEVDYEAELLKKDAELAKLKEEKENYRKGMLKAKGKLPEEDDNSSEEDMDAKIERKVNERILATREAQIQSEKDAIVAASMKKVKELSLALKNRGQINTTSGSGSNEDKPGVKVEKTLSQDQINSFKSKGWSDAKIESFKNNLSIGVSKSALPK